MRLGELKNILDLVTTADNRIKYNPENLYEGRLFRIKNFDPLIKALENVAHQDWVKVDSTIVDKLIEKYDTDDTVDISPDENNQLTSLINEINKGLPIFYGILDSILEEQEETIINIKIPEKSIQNFTQLNKFNKEIQDVFNLIVKFKGLNGDIKFSGFDVGTSWYKVLILGSPLVYSAFLGTIEIADKLIALRKEWYESEETRLHVEAQKEALAAEEERKHIIKVTEKDIQQHVEILFKKSVHKEVCKLISDLEVQENQNPHEMEISLVKGIYKIIDLIEKGAEFYPSLNPPDYISTSERDFYIDYEKLREALVTKEEPAQIEDKTEE